MDIYLAYFSGSWVVTLLASLITKQ